MATRDHMVECKVCGELFPDYLPDHLLEDHDLAVGGYLAAYPGALTMSQRLWDRYTAETVNIRRQHPPSLDNLTLAFAGVPFHVNHDIPSSACLPLPAQYRVPKYGSLGEDIQHAAVALLHGRSIYVWGMPGTGKDALFHAWSALTRTPAIIKQVKPGTDIESWFFTRAFNEKGTYWEEGAVLRALRDGYKTASGRVVPYMFLVTDFDRADQEQAENLRLITDSIQGRIDGPGGTTYEVLPGTRIVATGNTAGGGDERGRMLSASPIDASIMDRFERKLQFHWLDWRDEKEIVTAKFPDLLRLAPSILDKMKLVTKALRDAIATEDLHGEFSHRAICSILGHAEDIVAVAGKVDKALLKRASRVWVDGLPDEENRMAAKKIMDPTLGTLPEGSTAHVNRASPLTDLED